MNKLFTSTVAVAALAAGCAAIPQHAAHAAPVASATSTTDTPTSDMYFVTANIGRGYQAGAVVGAMKRIKGDLYDVGSHHPRFIGWQEIDEDDSANEMGDLKSIYSYDTGWRRTIYLDNDPSKPLRVPETAHDAQKSSHRVVKGSDGMAHVSPARYVTVTRYANQKISLLNTHFIAGAWTKCSTAAELQKCKERRPRWSALWTQLQAQVKTEHAAGYNVVITADWNRTLSGGWNPAQIVSGGRLVRADGVDHIVAVPRAGWKVTKLKKADGSFRQGSWTIGIDGHKADWVGIKFGAS